MRRILVLEILQMVSLPPFYVKLSSAPCYGILLSPSFPPSLHGLISRSIKENTPQRRLKSCQSGHRSEILPVMLLHVRAIRATDAPIWCEKRPLKSFPRLDMVFYLRYVHLSPLALPQRLRFCMLRVWSCNQHVAIPCEWIAKIRLQLPPKDF